MATGTVAIAGILPPLGRAMLQLDQWPGTEGIAGILPL
uniref:Uncharacterized protein n=1 Tax=Pseudomonas syringae pv. actinidiae TaxID=103796 RepID=A0A2P0QHN0_PSESF|nr:hypothetical protein [Pseudomonas syringae pv. actinidiae]